MTVYVIEDGLAERHKDSTKRRKSVRPALPTYGRAMNVLDFITNKRKIHAVDNGGVLKDKYYNQLEKMKRDTLTMDESLIQPPPAPSKHYF